MQIYKTILKTFYTSVGLEMFIKHHLDKGLPKDRIHVYRIKTKKKEFYFVHIDLLKLEKKY